MLFPYSGQEPSPIPFVLDRQGLRPMGGVWFLVGSRAVVKIAKEKCSLAPLEEFVNYPNACAIEMLPRKNAG